MNRRDLFWFLGIEAFAIVWAAALFANLESKLLAGGLAGGYFVVTGLFMIWRASRWTEKWKSLTWYWLIAHVFLISLPMLISRFMQMQTQFTDVRILGIAGPEFHNLSTAVFSVLILATLTDLVRTLWTTKK
jgi:hypothetical protein